MGGVQRGKWGGLAEKLGAEKRNCEWDVGFEFGMGEREWDAGSQKVRAKVGVRADQDG